MSGAINGLGDYYSNYTNTDATSEKLQNSLNTKDYSTSSTDELMEACKEFESYFVEQVIKSMEKMIPKDDEEDSSVGSSYLSYFGDSMVQELAKEVTDQNDFGLAQSLYEQMKRNYGIEEK